MHPWLADAAARLWPLATPGNVALGLAAAAGAYALVQLLRIATGDADLSLRAAVRRLPSHSGFEGKVVLITGASSGIGRELALELSKRGATLILAARRVDVLMRVAEECMAAGSPSAEAYKLDVTATDSHEAVVAAIRRKHGRIDILVNNAGRSQRGLAERTPLAVTRELFELDFFGTISVTQAVLKPALEVKQALHIVNTSSVAGKVGTPIGSSYAAAKHALQGYMDSLRMECGWRGVAVTNVCPGPVHSEIALHAFTEKQGVAHGGAGEAGDAGYRMPTARCAQLVTAAIHARLEEVWLSPNPVLAFTYVGQYCKWLYWKLGATAGRKRVEAFLHGGDAYASTGSLSALLGGKAKPKAG